MSCSWQAGVKANLSHFVRPSHEEVDDSICYHTWGIPFNNMVEPISEMQTVSIRSTFLHWNGVAIRGGVAGHLPHCTTNLRSRQEKYFPAQVRRTRMLKWSETNRKGEIIFPKYPIKPEVGNIFFPKGHLDIQFKTFKAIKGLNRELEFFFEGS